jgi:hypothetical protein
VEPALGVTSRTYYKGKNEGFQGDSIRMKKKSLVKGVINGD